MNISDKEKIDFIKISLQIEQLHAIVDLIDRSELIKAIEITPEEEKTSIYYKKFRYTLEFIDKLREDYIKELVNG